jgi:hypothetical protein
VGEGGIEPPSPTVAAESNMHADAESDVA